MKRSVTIDAGSFQRTSRARGSDSGGTRKRRRRKVSKVAVKSFRERVERVIRAKAEPKYIDFGEYGNTVAQLSGNVSGHSTIAFSQAAGMWPDRGTSVNQRIGNQISVTGLNLALAFGSQSAQHRKMQIRVMLCCMHDTDVNSNFAISEYLVKNQWISDANSGAAVYDYTCMRAPVFKETYETIAEKEVQLNPMDIGNASDHNTNVNWYIPLEGTKFEFNGTSGDPSNKNYRLVVVASIGNKSVTTASTLNSTYEDAVSTGVYFDISGRLYYKDL